MVAAIRRTLFSSFFTLTHGVFYFFGTLVFFTLSFSAGHPYSNGLHISMLAMLCACYLSRRFDNEATLTLEIIKKNGCLVV